MSSSRSQEVFPSRISGKQPSPCQVLCGYSTGFRTVPSIHSAFRHLYSLHIVFIPLNVKSQAEVFRFLYKGLLLKQNVGRETLTIHWTSLIRTLPLLPFSFLLCWDHCSSQTITSLLCLLIHDNSHWCAFPGGKEKSKSLSSPALKITILSPSLTFWIILYFVWVFYLTALTKGH